MWVLKKFSLKKRIYILNSLILCTLLGGIGIFLLNKPKEIEAGWWNETWLYRRVVNINNDSGEELEEFQLVVTLDTASLITDGKMQNDCDDIRITDVNGNLLDYWIKNCNTSSTQVWPKIPIIYTTGTAVYLYYGNSSAEAGKRKVGTENYPGLNCRAILDAGDSSGTEKYWIDPTNGSSSDKFEAYCDMSTDGGGWTLIGKGREGWGWNNNGQGTLSEIAQNPNSSTVSYMPSTTIDTIIGKNVKDLNDGVRVHRFGVDQDWRFSYPTMTTWDWVMDTSKTATVISRSPSCSGTTSGNTRDTYWCGGGNDCNRIFTWAWASHNSVRGWSAGSSCSCTSYGSDGWCYASEGHVILRTQVWVKEPYSNTKNVSTESLGTEEVSPAPVAYWKLDEGTGTVAHDASGQDLHGSVVGTPAWQAESSCVSGSCMQFNASEYINLENPQSLQITGSQTISMWIKPANFSARRNPYAKAYGGEGTITQETNGRLTYYYGTAGGNASPYQGFSSSQSLTLNEWNHIAVVRDLENMKLYWYINGEKTAEATASYSEATASGLTAYIGNGYTSKYDGLIDEVKIYLYPRTPDQIKSDYIAGSSTMGSKVVLGHKPESSSTPITSNLIGYWKFDEGSGSTAYDSSGLGNDGTITGASWIPSRNCISGKCLYFDGTSKVFVPSSNNLGTGPDGAISFWTYVEEGSPGQGAFIYKSAAPLIYRSVDPYFSVYWAGAVNVYPGGVLFNFDDWYHLTLTWEDSDTIKWYINGRLEKTVSTAGLTTSSSSSITMGEYSNGNLKGYLDEVKIFNTALTPEQVLNEYNKGKIAVLGTTSPTIGNIWGGSASSEYCIPGDTSPCNPPVAEWLFDDNQGSIAKDTSGNNNNGTLVNSPSWSKGKEGSGLKFNGSNTYVDLGNNSSIRNFTDQITVSAWVKYSAYGGGGQPYSVIAVKGSPWTFLMENPSNKIRFRITAGGSDLNAADSVSHELNRWYHFTGTYDGQNIKIYKDGTLVGETPATGTLAVNDISAKIGTYQGSNYNFNGIIDQVRIYNYARTPAQIMWDYNRGAPIGHWRLDECQGTTAHDVSGNNNHGTININSSGTQTSVGTCTSGNTADAWYNGRNGKLNASLNFDGTDDYVQMNTTAFQFVTGDFSVTMWAKPTVLDDTYDGLITTDSTGDSAWKIVRDANRQYFQARYASTLVPYPTVTAGVWHQYGLIKSGSNLILYFDGKLVSTTTISGSISNSATSLVLGSYRVNDALNGSHIFNGLIDDVRIYNYPLTEEQIKLLYNDNAAVKF